MVRGGYFSPQNYVSVSLPVSLTEKYDNWTMKLGGSVGYQSYSQDKSAYFPTNSEWQQTLGDGGEQWVCQGSLLLRDLEERHRVYPARRGGLQGQQTNDPRGVRLAMTPSGIITKAPPGSIFAIC